ncbi:MAG: keto-deoxy-phosphogluconate aldolase, partial [Pseudomonas neustonica]
MDMTQTLDTLFAEVTLLPVISIEREADILPLADALAAGGITTLEVTLRTPFGLPAIELLR